MSWERVTDHRVQLSVEDGDVGPDAGIPAKGIGRKLVSRFAKQLGEDFRFIAHGDSQFVLTMPGRCLTIGFARRLN